MFFKMMFYISSTLLFTLVVISSFSEVGCNRHIATPEQQFKILFEGFDLILVDDYPAEKSFADFENLSFTNTHPKEHKLIPNRVYIFINATTISTEELGITVLPKRLVQIHANLKKAPKSEDDFIYLFIGEPLFSVQFEKNGHKGLIFNRGFKTKAMGEELVVIYK